MADGLKCPGRFLDQARGEEAATGWAPDYEGAVRDATAAAPKKVDAKIAEALKALRCPQSCETWHKLWTELIIDRQSTVIKTRFFEVMVTLKWHLDILCWGPTTTCPGSPVE